MHVDQKNILVLLDMRPLERTLTDADAIELRNRVYAPIHEGAAGGRPPADRIRGLWAEAPNCSAVHA